MMSFQESEILKIMIIGITGALGAGKGKVVECLVKKGFKHYSVRAFLTDAILSKKMPLNRDSMVKVANELREKHGADYIAQQLFEQAKAAGGNSVIESIRTVGEAVYLRERGGTLWAVEAKIKIRFDRIVARGSETDHVSFEKFVSDEQREMENTDEKKQNIAAVVALADIVLQNNGTVKELNDQIEKALSPH